MTGALREDHLTFLIISRPVHIRKRCFSHKDCREV